ncbi:hypothetical protein CWE09_07510 [Aliidiomarina minuta]|uniref:HTH araC/xylS-type domain-containing protein n=1 Tax=Aliidiomarina minuta TaxID=880057 RepID=A0A432W985_9GAMM|nr:helix-turn-helix domain-containing protein [Aliidiomarina minuta]RUO26546.1 hypothetical protein CWE09_07510 [Aliidiomarina minuta]
MTFHAFGLSELQQTQLGWRSRRPAPALRPWIEHYYLLRPQGESESYRLYPDGGSTLTIPLQDARAEACHFSLSRVNSQQLWRPDEQSLGIRFTPGGFYALFGLSMAEVKEATAGGLTGLPWLSLLCELVSDKGPFNTQQLDSFFLQHMQRRAPVAGAVQFWQEAGLRAPQEIRSFLKSKGVGRRTLERQFQLHVGVSPGQLYTWQRLKRARYLIRTRPEQRLTDLAFSLGYYDQAHFVRQFRQFCGQSPGQYRQRKLSQLYKAG